MKSNVIVFLGPSLSVAEAKKILPNACYHHPARCGDIFRVLTLQPRCLVLIDGLFEQTAAVWHKEILFALAQGVSVVGAASMGALRAAELDGFGMIGVGDIYEAYKNQSITGDDEVSLPHLDKAHAFKTQVTPLVNVRKTLRKAVLAEIICEAQEKNIFEHLKSMPYFQRDFFSTLKKLHIDSTWFLTNLIDQKQLDAKAALHAVANGHGPAKLPEQKVFYTLFTKRLYREVVSEPFDEAYDWLPPIDKKLVYLEKAEKRVLKDVAKLLQISAEISEILSIKKLIRHDAPVYSIDMIEKYYRVCRAEIVNETPRMTRAIKKIAELTQLVWVFFRDQGVALNPEYGQQFFNTFRREKKLLQVEAITAWFLSKNIDAKTELDHFVPMLAFFHYLIDQNRFDLFHIPIKMDNTYWLKQAYLESNPHDE